ncbi:MAG: nucleoside-diphosphate sugar epimerase/dehydratase [Gemella haemolysans]|uniref:polysaccharide biosynthesis protein n=1 Tax=Gemella TaxID=1378 RepID=UPI0023308EDD|nr:nucleoside-diphosphate sugar epimerase/dehydratase [Gemella haemolysans]MDB6214006.1 nucleoside-diphosphate sugar epimerase/dehydratase [Gemella haemolysans]MDU4713957.1 nucleoside-diphosphate sugar epimerase/dehydratase [Gemella haemolysans]
MDKLFSSKIYINHRFKLIMVLDLLTVIFGVVASIFLGKASDPFSMLNDHHVEIAEFLVISLVVYTISFYLFGTNKSLWSYLGVNEIVNICFSVVLGDLITSILYQYMLPDTFSNVRFAIFSPLLIIAGMMFTRMLYRALREREAGKYGANSYKNTFIIGAGDAGYILLKELSKNNIFRANVVGLIDDNRKNSVISGVTVVGTTYDMLKLIPKYEVEQVFLAIPSIGAYDKNRILNVLKEANVTVKVMSSGIAVEDGESISKHLKDVSIEDLLGRGEVKLSQGEIRSYIKGKSILVTGAGGSIGSQIVREIFKFKPSQLVLVDVNENALYMLERDLDFEKSHSKEYEDIQYISEIVSIREKAALAEVFDKYKPNVVFHAAAHKHVPLMERRPQEAIKNNVFGTKNVMDVAIEKEVERFIMISTDKAVNPTNAMGASKRLTEIILQSKGNKYKTKFAAVRFGNVLGSNGSVIPIFKEQIKKGGPITITHRNIIRYFMTIPEAAQLVLQAGYYASEGEIFLLDMGEPVKIIDLATNLIKLSGLEPYKDIDIEEIGLRPGEKMYEELSLDYESSEKTDNQMIYKNTTLDIDVDELDKKLNELKSMLGHSTNEEIRSKLFEIINCYNG